MSVHIEMSLKCTGCNATLVPQQVVGQFDVEQVRLSWVARYGSLNRQRWTVQFWCSKCKPKRSRRA